MKKLWTGTVTRSDDGRAPISGLVHVSLVLEDFGRCQGRVNTARLRLVPVSFYPSVFFGSSMGTRLKGGFVPERWDKRRLKSGRGGGEVLLSAGTAGGARV